MKKDRGGTNHNTRAAGLCVMCQGTNLFHGAGWNKGCITYDRVAVCRRQACKARRLGPICQVIQPILAVVSELFRAASSSTRTAREPTELSWMVCPSVSWV